MPTLNWIGKDKVVKHHQDVQFKTLEHKYGFTDKKGNQNEQTNSGNKIIHGDNLEALKALLPEYEGKIKCIYIDPPYNTGNEKWIYNDNVNHPKINKWLGEVVGKDGEDFTRHDKWLCMMYPRLKLLHKLLADEGLIFISLDDNEATFLKIILDEIFGENNFIQQIVWKNKYGPGAMTKGFGNIHEYIFCYSKSKIYSIESNLTEEQQAKYKLKDKYFNVRGGYITQPLATKSKDDRPNLVFPIKHSGIEIWPDKQWIWSKERIQNAYDKEWLRINEKNGKYSVRFKQYLKNENGKMRKGKPISIMIGPFNQAGTAEMVDIFDSKVFNNPKPLLLIEYLISMIINGDENNNGIYLDSFAGSGTLGHAVLNLNKKDGGNRKFIMIEMEDYANNITAERVKRVMKGYGKDKNAVEGTGGSFDFYELGKPIFREDKNLNEEVGEDKIREYIYYTETKQYLTRQREENHKYLLDTFNNTSYYFYYEKDKLTSLDIETLNVVTEQSEQYLIYADRCLLDKNYMLKSKIIFKKIPRDIKRF
ncbi:MAG: site-specific DNA-methyltransferase [Candidatus Cloacimonadota bacterium]|nr:site-specific DNA-methyltransferase [Candidatus Cloacimonadota bacterium]